MKEILTSELEEARAKAYSSINFYIVQAYWNIGKMIVKEQNGKERVEYEDFYIEECIQGN